MSSVSLGAYIFPRRTLLQRCPLRGQHLCISFLGHYFVQWLLGSCGFTKQQSSVFTCIMHCPHHLRETCALLAGSASSSVLAFVC